MEVQKALGEVSLDALSVGPLVCDKVHDHGFLANTTLSTSSRLRTHPPADQEEDALVVMSVWK